jgi:hypothetical protein
MKPLISKIDHLRRSLTRSRRFAQAALRKLDVSSRPAPEPIETWLRDLETIVALTGPSRLANMTQDDLARVSERIEAIARKYESKFPVAKTH